MISEEPLPDHPVTKATLGSFCYIAHMWINKHKRVLCCINLHYDIPDYLHHFPMPLAT